MQNNFKAMQIKMLNLIVLVSVATTLVFGLPEYNVENFKYGIEYEGSLPMSGGSDRYRHKNNYEPFYVSVTASARNDFVLTYLEVKATVDQDGSVEFHLVKGHPGSKTMTFQLISNHTDFLSYSYMSYGISEEKYKKLANIIVLPINTGTRYHLHISTFFLFIILYPFVNL